MYNLVYQSNDYITRTLTHIEHKMIYGLFHHRLVCVKRFGVNTQNGAITTEVWSLALTF